MAKNKFKEITVYLIEQLRKGETLNIQQKDVDSVNYHQISQNVYYLTSLNRDGSLTLTPTERDY